MYVDRTYLTYMLRGLMFCVVVRQVVFAWSPVNLELSCFYAIRYPVESHVNGLALLLLDSAIGYPFVVLLSVRIGVGGCGWPSSLHVTRSGTRSWAFMNSAAISASGAGATTLFSVFARTMMGALMILGFPVLLPM